MRQHIRGINYHHGNYQSELVAPDKAQHKPTYMLTVYRLDACSGKEQARYVVWNNHGTMVIETETGKVAYLGRWFHIDFRRRDVIKFLRDNIASALYELERLNY